MMRSSRIANSSPAKRATVSPGRTRVLQPPRHLDQELVAGHVPEGVVDGLEVVEVDEEHGEVALAPAVAGEGVVQALREERAVGEAGEGIVGAAVGDVRLRPRHAVGPALVAAAGEAAAEHPAVGAVAVPHPVLVLEAGARRRAGGPRSSAARARGLRDGCGRTTRRWRTPTSASSSPSMAFQRGEK